jgi:ribonuclease R
MKNRHNREQKTEKHPNNNRVIGFIKNTKGGIGYFISEDGKTNAEIPSKSLCYAMVGDKVEIRVSKSKSKGIYCEVEKIITHSKKFFVGYVEKSGNSLIVTPDDRRIKISILVSKEDENKVVVSDKVQIKIKEWKELPSFSTGEILKVIGKKGENNAEMESIVLDKGFEIEFPDNVEQEAKNISDKNKTVPKEEIVKRRDFRNTLTFTIDPETAKDFDDAISFEKLPNNNFQIGVHIADVSHYVRERSFLDVEALERGCSVYLPDRTIPMLPFELSDNLCSLNQGEDKLSFSAVFEITEKGKVVSRWFGKTIINSDKRFSYEEAQATLDKKEGKYFYELDTLNKIAKFLQKEKFQKGAIDFEQDEVAFELDNTGKVVRIYKKKRLDTHKLVEEYMLLANREVAEYIFKEEKKLNKAIPLPYRIHDTPNKEKIAELAIFVKALGYELKLDKNGNATGKSLQSLFAQIEGKSEESLIKTASIRSMAKAIYSTKNIGHFGLAFEYYAHFTSPIRRYPDLLTQRTLYKILNKETMTERDFAFYEKASIKSTENEIRAAEAERESKKLKQIEFMQDKIGQEFEGSITGVTDWGIYVEDSNTRAEGLVRLSSLKNDYYEVDTKTYSLIGRKTKQKYSLGEKVKIKLVGLDLDKRTMDFEITQ